MLDIALCSPLTPDYNNRQRLIQHVGVTFLLFLISCYIGLAHIYEAKSIHKMEVINSPYYQSLSALDKSFVRTVSKIQEYPVFHLLAKSRIN